MADILHELTIKSPIEKVYRALTEAQGLSGWWTSGSKAQPTVGTISEFPFPGIVLKLKVDSLEPGKKVVWSVAEAVPDWNDTLITWDLTDVEGGTKVLFGHRHYASTDGMYARFNISWAWHIMSLRDYLETGNGHPGPTPF